MVLRERRWLELLATLAGVTSRSKVESDRLAGRMMASFGLSRYFCVSKTSALIEALRSKGAFAGAFELPPQSSIVPPAETIDQLSQVGYDQPADVIYIDIHCKDADPTRNCDLPARLAACKPAAVLLHLRFDQPASAAGHLELLEPAFLDAGFRKHPKRYRLAAYEGTQNRSHDLLLAFEHGPVDRKEDVASHDMLRRADDMSAMELAAYDLCGGLAPLDGRILSISPFGGAGAYVLRETSLASVITEIVEDAVAFDYLQTHYPVPPEGRLRTLYSPSLRQKPGWDLVVENFVGRSSELVRILNDRRDLVAPGCRYAAIIKMADCGEAAGIVESLTAAFADEWLVDDCWIFDPRRGRIRPSEWLPHLVAPEASDAASSLFLLVLNRNPSRVDVSGMSPSKDYLNPALQRSLVDRARRLKDAESLADHAAQTLAEFPVNSADHGAALCVLAYRLLERPEPHSQRVHEWQTLRPRIDQYLEEAVPDRRGIRRWKISLCYVGGLISRLLDDTSAEIAYFERCGASDALTVTPLIATKTVGANVALAVRALARQDLEAATRFFRRGFAQATAAISADLDDVVGDPLWPPPVGLAEIGQIAALGAKCARGLRAIRTGAGRGSLWSYLDNDVASERENIELAYLELAHWARDLTDWNAAIERHASVAQ